ncbi:hypothetical protein [Photorhabdus akhurstii]|uniref:hypothetical protein n=1 Tax=Photorhabdus akhurstii TaxID=171438 RepID=UPI00068BAE8A|nr:hypothetical protein [Photorhabdus akhurstii]
MHVLPNVEFEVSAESKLTRRSQTTIPTSVRKALKVTAPRRKNGEASHFSGRHRLYDGFTLASVGRDDESRRL